jgi:hypothetical protein
MMQAQLGLLMRPLHTVMLAEIPLLKMSLVVRAKDQRLILMRMQATQHRH